MNTNKASDSLRELVDYFGVFWKPFLAEPHSDPETLIQFEIDRFRNLSLQATNKWPPPREETTEEYITRMVYSNGVDPSTARQP